MGGFGTKGGGRCGGWEAPCSKLATRVVDGIWFCDSCAEGRPAPCGKIRR